MSDEQRCSRLELFHLYKPEMKLNSSRKIKSWEGRILGQGTARPGDQLSQLFMQPKLLGVYADIERDVISIVERADRLSSTLLALIISVDLVIDVR